jgi:hypothetical protein
MVYVETRVNIKGGITDLVPDIALVTLRIWGRRERFLRRVGKGFVEIFGVTTFMVDFDKVLHKGLIDVEDVLEILYKSDGRN